MSRGGEQRKTGRIQVGVGLLEQIRCDVTNAEVCTVDVVTDDGRCEMSCVVVWMQRETRGVGPDDDAVVVKPCGKGIKDVVKKRDEILLCCEELEEQGFSARDVEVSVKRVIIQQSLCGGEEQDGRGGGKKDGIVLSNLVMNDLLSRLERQDLPEYYLDQSTPVSQAEVRRHNVGVRGGGQHTSEVLDLGEEKPAAVDPHEEMKKIGMVKKEREEEKQCKKEEWKQSKAWILQNAYGEDSSDESAVESRHGSESSWETNGDGEIEDWEIWGAPEEVERKKAEKARSTLSREDRILIISNDMRKAREKAATAKQQGDKTGQREAGSIIGQLKREMQQIGITDDDIDLSAIPQNKASTNSGDDKLKLVGKMVDQPHSDDEEAFADFGLFDDTGEGDDEELSRPNVGIKNESYLSILSNKNLRESVRKRKQGKCSSKDEKARNHPKALLQQLVQKEGWGAPRFGKIEPGGNRNPQGPQIRFQVQVDVKRSKGKRLTCRPGLHRYSLDPTLDGWDTIQQAQDACATKALIELFGTTDEIQWELLVEPYDALVLEIAEKQPHEAAASQARGQDREEFVDQLLEELLEKFSHEEKETKEHLANNQEGETQKLLSESIREMIESLKSRNLHELSRNLQAKHRAWISSEEGRFWMAKRKGLPVSAIESDLISSLEGNDIVIVSGDTGCGKTTQVPQMILDQALERGTGGECNIICTQPRRIAAISVADRVSEERGEPGPGKKNSVVGYSVRFDSATTRSSRLVFCTTGILLRRLSSDPALASLSHIIVDEVHERTMQSDFLIAMLKDLVRLRRNAGMPLKVVLMSATLNAEMISEYFEGCPVLHASGRNFPVRHLFLEDVYDMTQYVLCSDSAACLREDGKWKERQRQLTNTSGSKHKSIMQCGWGDDSVDHILNPYYDEELYSEYG